MGRVDAGDLGSEWNDSASFEAGVRGRPFDDVAGRYDLLNDLFSLFLHRGWRRASISDFRAIGKGVILDVCTGTAEAAIAMAQRFTHLRVVGVDVSSAMLKKGQEKVDRLGIGERVSLRLADGLKLPFSDACFDAVYNGFGLRNQGSFSQAMREMARVLRPGGAIRILEFSLPKNASMRRIYSFYLARVMPVMGQFFGAPRSAYEYLAASVQQFISREQVLAIMRESGLTDASYQDMSGGIVCCYRGTKS